jgi:chromosome segregation ATPase
MKKLNRYKDNADNNLRNYEDNCTRAQKMFDEYEQIKGSFGNRVSTIQAENDKREDTLNSYYNSLNELTHIKSQFDFIQSEIEKLRQDSIFFQKEISDLTQEKNNLEAKIPQLEKDKKAFATTRNFKVISVSSV